MNPVPKPSRFPRLRALCGALLACLAVGLPQAQIVFDPVNDDTDIFLANPDLPENQPNVIIYVDNTANWNNAFANEKSALKGVVDNLSETFNVGLMLFPETGGDNDSVDGGYVRFSVRQMTTANKSILSEIVNDFDVGDDKGNNATTALGMREAYRYFAGKQSVASHGKIKTDYANNDDFKACSSCSVTEHPATTAALGDFALDSNAGGTEYNSPIANNCQNNFIIYISNGPANENASALAESETELDSLGVDVSSTIGITPDGQEGNWMDEWANYMANADVNADLDGDQHVFTYVVEVDPGTTGQAPDMTALLKSVALKGKGEYFAVSSGNAGQAIVNALNQIFQEIQAVNSVFASTTLPVSVNVRGTNLNQVYIGVFRPDAVKQPRWFGNLKMYQLGFDDATNTLFLADASGDKAENPETGFINPSSPSFWSSSTAFWSYRTAEENGSGGASDLPDGDLVEKGGAAQQQRMDFASDQSTRNLYTCTIGTLSPDCVENLASPPSLSDTPFDTTNDGITDAALEIGITAVSSLTGFATQSVTNLTDSRSVSALSTATGGVSVTNLDNGVVSQSVSSISTTVTKTITSLTNNQVTQTLSALVHDTTGGSKNIARATLNGHGYSTGQTVTIAGADQTDFNGTFVITVVDANKFTYDGGSALVNEAAAATGTITAATTSSIVTATVPSHGFESNQQVTIAGVTPTSYNSTYNITVVNSNTFTFTTASALSPITSFAGATATGQTKTATVTTPSDHGYNVGEFVTINGATPADYEGTVEVLSVPTSKTFTYSVANRLADATGTLTVSQGSTTVTATAPGHGFVNGQTVTITGASPDGYNGSFAIANVDTSTPGAETFQYTTAQPLTQNTGASVVAAGGTSSSVTAAVTAHQFGSAGDTADVIIEGVTNFPAAYNGTVTATIVDANTFTYDTEDGSAPDPATGTITARLASATAFATVPGHGYGNAGDTFTVTIGGATPGEYNRSNVTATVVDAGTFSYPLLTITELGEATGTITSSIKTTTARARVVAHGFTDQSQIEIAGASPANFNGTFTITLVDSDNFTYDLTENDPATPAQGDASGSIVASTGSISGTESDNLIAWVRGADNFEDENTDSSNTDIRASVHGDVLHSRPAVVNYNRHGNDNDVYIFYGSNDAIFRAVKGGFTQSDAGEPEPGHEAWGFIPEEFFGDLKRLRNNEPTISSFNKKPYFADGSIGTYVVDDAPADGKLDVTLDPDDKVHIFISMRRGGRFLYALDVSDPADPKLLWKRSSSDLGWEELGYTWSVPRVVNLVLDHDGNDSTAPQSTPVLMFGAGYDPTVEDVDPATITASDADQVKASAAIYPRTMGRGIFVVNAADGEILWQAGPADAVPTDPAVDHHFETVDGMDYAIPSDLTIIRDRNGNVLNRAYVGDTGGNVWRVDMADPDVEDWIVTKLASVADTSGLTGDIATSDQSGLRKFLFPPDVVYSEDGYDAVLIGSGDREHPFDEVVVNRMYMFKDTGTATSPVRGTATSPDELKTIVGEDPPMFDATSNCIQDSDACDSVAGETPTTALADLESADGWFITLGDGEKVVGTAVTLNNVTFFNTNQPSSGEPTSCTSDLGIARQYQVLFDTAEALLDQNIDGSIDALDRAQVHPGGGYLPSPVPVVVEIEGQTHEGVISGVAVEEPPGSLLNARLRKFWYKEME